MQQLCRDTIAKAWHRILNVYHDMKRSKNYNLYFKNIHINNGEFPNMIINKSTWSI